MARGHRRLERVGAARAAQGKDFAREVALARRLCADKGMRIGLDGVQLTDLRVPASVLGEALATSLGLQPQAVARLMRDLGFRPAANDLGWVWKGAPRQPERKADPGHAFAALAKLRRNG